MKKLLETIAYGSPEIDGLALILGLVCSIACAFFIQMMYATFYSDKNSSSGIRHSFLIIAPAVTAVFLTIQTSLPLSLGLLGSLSFIRFRTPIKDAEEIAYLLLVVACAVGCATFHLGIVAALLALATLAQLISKGIVNEKVFGFSHGSIIVTVKATDDFTDDATILSILSRHFTKVRLKHLSKSGDSVHLQYTYRQSKLPKVGVLLNDFKEQVKSLTDINLLTTAS